MNFSRFLHQTVQYGAITGTNDRDDATYATAVPVQARFHDRTSLVYKSLGETAGSSALVWLLFEPNEGDLINGQEVLDVTSMLDVTGNAVGWKAKLR